MHYPDVVGERNMSKKTDQTRVHSQATRSTKFAAKRRKRGTKFRTQGWYTSAAGSIAITSTGKGDRVGGHWISQLNGDVD